MALIRPFQPSMHATCVICVCAVCSHLSCVYDGPCKWVKCIGNVCISIVILSAFWHANCESYNKLNSNNIINSYNFLIGGFVSLSIRCLQNTQGHPWVYLFSHFQVAFDFWIICHNSIRTLSLLIRRSQASGLSCGLDSDEVFAKKTK